MTRAAPLPRRRPHVAVVVPSLAAGGAESVAVTLCRELAQRVDLMLVTVEPRLSRRQLKRLDRLPWADRVPEGCTHVHLPGTGRGLTRLLGLAVRLAALARRERFDAVLSLLTWTNVLVVLARLLGGRYRHVASEHALADSLRSDGGGLAALARILPLAYRAPDHVVVVSEAVRQSLRSAGALPRPGRVAVIANPVDLDDVVTRSRDPLDLDPPSPGPLLVCVARLHEQKDHPTLLRAFALLPASSLLVLAGDGPRRDEIAAAAGHLDLAERVVLTGALANPFPLVRAADVVVLPSREEGFGLVALEAAAIGTPFVGSDVGGLGELCRRLGQRTFDVGDHEALAEAVRAALAGPRPEPDPEALAPFRPGAVADAYLDLLLGDAAAGCITPAADEPAGVR